MDRKRLFKNLAYLVVFIFLANYVAVRLYWYSSIWYFDMLMHFSGGVFLGLLIIWFLFPRIFKEYFPPALSLGFTTKILLGVLAIGVAWEFFEIVVNNNFAQIPFSLLDTVSDVFFDLAGGAIATLYAFFVFPKTMGVTLNKVQ